MVCPVDGAISQFGRIEDGGRIFQAKGHQYSAGALLGGDEALAARFDGGCFATLYLSPRDYHRIHMPCAGTLRQMLHVPGALFSVNPTTAQGVPGLFARNERVVCLFDTAHGPLALVLVGATIVGSMATVWHGVVNPPRPGHLRAWRYDEGATIKLAQGQEMGRFLLGSTVVLLWPDAAAWQFNPAWAAGGQVRLGEVMATRAAAALKHPLRVRSRSALRAPTARPALLAAAQIAPTGHRPPRADMPCVFDQEERWRKGACGQAGGRLGDAEQRSVRGPRAARRASCSDSSQLSERSDRRERSEFCDGAVNASSAGQPQRSEGRLLRSSPACAHAPLLCHKEKRPQAGPFP
jgi:phosphatidylserine decarboxylase